MYLVACAICACRMHMNVHPNHTRTWRTHRSILVRGRLLHPRKAFPIYFGVSIRKWINIVPIGFYISRRLPDGVVTVPAAVPSDTGSSAGPAQVFPSAQIAITMIIMTMTKTANIIHRIF